MNRGLCAEGLTVFFRVKEIERTLKEVVSDEYHWSARENLFRFLGLFLAALFRRTPVQTLGQSLDLRSMNTPSAARGVFLLLLLTAVGTKSTRGDEWKPRRLHVSFTGDLARQCNPGPAPAAEKPRVELVRVRTGPARLGPIVMGRRKHR